MGFGVDPLPARIKQSNCLRLRIATNHTRHRSRGLHLFRFHWKGDRLPRDMCRTWHHAAPIAETGVGIVDAATARASDQITTQLGRWWWRIELTLAQRVVLFNAEWQLFIISDYYKMGHSGSWEHKRCSTFFTICKLSSLFVTKKN